MILSFLMFTCFAEDTERAIEEHIQQMLQHINKLAGQSKEIKAEEEKSAKEVAERLAELEKKNQTIEARTRELNALNQKAAELEKQHGKSEAEMKAVGVVVQSLKNDLHKLELEQKKDRAEHAKLSDAHTEAAKKHSAVTERKKKHLEKVKEAHGKIVSHS